MRYWDGVQWTEQYSDAPAAAPAYTAPAAQYAATPQASTAPTYSYNQPAAGQTASVQSTLKLVIPALILGGLSFFLSWFALTPIYAVVFICGILGLGSGVAGVVLSMMAGKIRKSALTTIGMILGIVSAVFCLLFTIIGCSCACSMGNIGGIYY